jgi:hypothetical protein
MSPEQVSGDVVGSRSDIFSLGLVAFLPAHSTLPYPDGSVQEIFLARLSGKPMPLAEARPDIKWPRGLRTRSTEHSPQSQPIGIRRSRSSVKTSREPSSPRCRPLRRLRSERQSPRPRQAVRPPPNRRGSTSRQRRRQVGRWSPSYLSAPP